LSIKEEEGERTVKDDAREDEGGKSNGFAQLMASIYRVFRDEEDCDGNNDDDDDDDDDDDEFALKTFSFLKKRKNGS